MPKRSLTRKAISCMCAGLLIAVSLFFFFFAWETDWLPRRIVPVAAIAMGIIGVMWLRDELSDILTDNP